MSIQDLHCLVCYQIVSFLFYYNGNTWYLKTIWHQLFVYDKIFAFTALYIILRTTVSANFSRHVFIIISRFLYP